MRRIGIAGSLFIASCAPLPVISPDSPKTFDLGAGVTARIDYLDQAGDPVLNVLMSASSPWGSMALAVDGGPDVEAVLRLESGAEIRGLDRSKGFPAWGGSAVWQSSVRFCFRRGDPADPPRSLFLRLYEWKGIFDVATGGLLTKVVRGKLALGTAAHVKLDHDRIELDLMLNAEPNTLTLIVDAGVPGLDSQDWNETELKATVGYEGGGESKGFVLQPGFSCWVGCLHHLTTRAVLSYPGKVEGGEPRFLEVRIRNSRLLFQVAGR